MKTNKNVPKRAPKIRFTEEERSHKEMKKSIKKVEKQSQKADKAQDKIPKKKQARIRREVDKQTGKSKIGLQFEEVTKPPPSRLQHTLEKKTEAALSSPIHKKISQYEQDNVGIQTAHIAEKAVEQGVRLGRNAAHRAKLRPYRKAAKAEKRLEKANIKAMTKSGRLENPSLHSNPISRWQQKRAIKKEYAVAKKAGASTFSRGQTGKAAKKAVSSTGTAIKAFVKNPKVIAVILALSFLIALIAGATASCSMLMQSGMSSIAMTTYPSEESDMLAVEGAYAAKEMALQNELNNYESLHGGYDEYEYQLDYIGHDPHELAAYLSAKYLAYTLRDVSSELDRVFQLQYVMETTERTEIRTKTETRTNPDTGSNETVSVEYECSVLTVTLQNTSIHEIAQTELKSDELDLYTLYRTTLGNKPLLFGGGSGDTSGSYDLSGVVFIDGKRPGNQAVVDIALSQVGNVGGAPYWSWYGFPSRVAWCACFVSWCIAKAGYSEPKFAHVIYGGISWFSAHGQWAPRGYPDLAPGDLIFFDWQNDGETDHVGMVIGTDGTNVYTVEGNSGNACKVKSYPLNSPLISGYGLMNW